MTMKSEQELRDYLQACWERREEPTKQQVSKHVFADKTVSPVVNSKDDPTRVYGLLDIYVCDFGTCEVELVEDLTADSTDLPHMTRLLFQFTTKEGAEYGDAFHVVRDYAASNACHWKRVGSGSHYHNGNDYDATAWFEMSFPSKHLYDATKQHFANSSNLMKATG